MFKDVKRIIEEYNAEYPDLTVNVLADKIVKENNLTCLGYVKLILKELRKDD